jgi:MYXO-CTERM domain-containing protein
MDDRASRVALALAAGLVLVMAASSARAGYSRTFPAGSLVIPMDLAYQDTGMLQAYGLVFQLLDHGVTVYWVIDDEKVWHHADCDTPGDECAWDCEDEGSGPCPYPTASPDFSVGAMVLWDGDGDRAPGTMITRHGYRGGPFVIDAEDADDARPIIDAWNDQSMWAASPFAMRSVFHVVSVHETTGELTGNVEKEMVQAPTIAVFSDGNEQIATGYLRAAGIPQSNGREFPIGRCAAGQCGPGTMNPDMLTVESIMGDMGTCEAPNTDHSNGALFNAEGRPAYCQIMSMHWDVADRETVRCDDGDCPATQAECSGETFTYHGHEVVAEVRSFLGFATHFFAECQAVNAYENTVPNPAWPFLDDAGRRGHFLTTEGTPPDCPCTEDGFTCVTNGCDGGTRSCCIPEDVRERGAGFLIADQPDSGELQVLNVGIAYNQLDGAYETTGGSEPAYNLSEYLGSAYINDLDVTFITGPMGPRAQDVWMTGFIDGECDINEFDEFMRPGECGIGKVSYLGGHQYRTEVPISGNLRSQGTRLFLNALFEADCVTGGLSNEPAVGLQWTGRRLVPSAELPVSEPYGVRYTSTGGAPAEDAVLVVTLPAGLSVSGIDAGGVQSGDTITWDVGTLAVGADAVVHFDAELTAAGDYDFDAVITFSGTRDARATYSVVVDADRDGDGVPDGDDPEPDDPRRCGDSDSDGCDDCANGTFDPDNDCGVDGGTGGPDDGGCGCSAIGTRSAPLALVMLALLALVRRRLERASGATSPPAGATDADATPPSLDQAGGSICDVRSGVERRIA